MQTVNDVRPGPGELTAAVAEILNALTRDWELDFSGGIGPGTRLVADLAFESIDMVQFIVSLGDHFQRADLPFEELLMAGGRYVDDLRVADVVAFLHAHV